ncbi:hypothetical protein [Pontibacter chinhatensis]|uniref:Uncharacterized protein n=1 Tax=Pontibacter chinhatensis TaxID=1436961 RepID=A0A1I2XJL3_9BACT|nr:hypothetical protein [Pontibacter chinhatensis]SFH13605.1 hypothetical protein SAMN05421739_10687 [Pontibacter chinhatensis]
MKKYETAELRVDDAGIALLRSRYAYRKFSYDEIAALHIRRGSLVNNPGAVGIMGVGLIAAGIYIANMFSPLNITEAELGFRGGKALGYLIFVVFGLLCFGGILLYKSVQRDFVLVIRAEGFKMSYPLTELRKSGELDNFLLALQEKAGDKLTLLIRELILK